MAGLRGRVFGGFQLAEQMSGGGIAEVYRARSNKPGGREVVVKVIHPEFAHQPGFLPHFREIVQTSARLTNHPHILPLIASGEDQGYLYLVTPFVAAGTLSDRIRSGGGFGPADVAPFFRQLCDALAYAHSLGVHHDNIKPSNIFLFEGRHVLVGDFGLLWSPSMMDMDQSGSGAEAVEYMAPELMRGPGGQQADIYGVGAVLFAALTGKAPFPGGKPADVFAAHARQPVPHLAQVNPNLPPPLLALDPVIQRAMAKRPEERYPSAATMAQAIETATRQGMQGGAAQPFPGAGQPQAFPNPGLGGPLAGQGNGAWPAVSGAGLGMAPGAFGMSGPIGGPNVPQSPGMPQPMGFGQLNPPFPPLPGFAASGTPAHNQPQFEVGNLPTARVPAPGPLPSAGGQALDPAALATIYSPAAQLGRIVTTQSPLTDDTSDDTNDGPNFGPQALRAVRPGAGPLGDGVMSNPGFTVAGGNANWSANGAQPERGANQWTMTGPLGDDRFDNGTAQRIQALKVGASGPLGSDELAAERAAWQSQRGAPGAADDSAALGGWGGRSGNGHDEADYSGPLHNGDERAPGSYSGSLYTDEYSRAQPAIGDDTGQFGAHTGRAPGDDRPFSATQLKLPRLDAPGSDHLSSSWQDVVSGKFEVPRASGPRDHAGWAASAADRGDAWRDDGAGWQAQSSANGWDSAPLGESVFAPAVNARTGSANADTPWTADASAYQAAVSARPDKKRQRASEDDGGFDDDRVWTTGHTAIRVKRRRRVRRLVLLLVFVLIFDMAALVVSRPDLCPTSGCRQLSGSLHQRFPALDRLTAPSALALSATPTTVKLTVTVGQNASEKVTVTNLGALPENDQISSSLAWVSVTPSSGVLAAGQGMQVTIEARPDAKTSAGIHTGSVTIFNGKNFASITMIITVNAAP
ncbi:MAG TPA: protein kinase [Ktedonobacterales bacterium]|nr:protein kinase [Ktedonobacterales bacterium]